MSQFSEIIGRIEEKVKQDRTHIEPNKKLLILCWTQLRLLNAVYYSMLEVDIGSHMNKIHSKDFDYQEYYYKNINGIINYFSFINILNQFGRVLEKRYNLSIPRYIRIRFFRNKVLEHWEEYAESGFIGAQYQKHGEPAVPSIWNAHVGEERLKIKSEIDKILLGCNLSIDFENPKMGNVVDLPENTEKVYVLLETIDPTLNARKKGKHLIPDDLITLLFKFGFPVPIASVKEYSNELITFLEEKLNLVFPTS